MAVARPRLLALLWLLQDAGASVCCPGCSCDLHLVEDLDAMMQGLGYDRCVDDGPCEKCGGVEMHAPYCSTGQRQKVICTRCSDESILPFCQPGYRIFWSSNESSMDNLTAPSAGLFLRSCRKAREPEAPKAPEAEAILEPAPEPVEADTPPRKAPGFHFGGDGDEGSMEAGAEGGEGGRR
ncbi:unnamed protein product [Effrenium voratum]|nr:unnamed protein product [Effrenium voratum]